MEKYQEELEIQVRDYECDFQGIVNNAVYQNYLEHARHTFFKNHHLDFIELSKRGINLVVIRAEIDYLAPLKYSENIIVCSTFLRVSKLRFGFKQDIYLVPDRKPVIKALIIGTSLNADGKPFLPEELDTVFARIVNA
jgi:acyl-CoA thioester hydrolase